MGAGNLWRNNIFGSSFNRPFLIQVLQISTTIQMLYANEKMRGVIKTLRIKNEYVLFVDNPESYHLGFNLSYFNTFL